MPDQLNPTNYANQGYGPVNYQNQAPDPFAQMDNFINYNNMVRAQQVEQYQQQLLSPPQLTQRQAYMAVTGRRFQYGVDAVARETMYRSFQRRNDMQREVFAAKIGSDAITFAGSTALGGVAAAALGAGALGTLGLMSAAAIPFMPMGMAVGMELNRREFSANIATDLDTYRRKIGGNFSYAQNTALANQLQRSMYRGNQFFDKEDQMGIMKTGLAYGMLDTKNWNVDQMMKERGGRIDSETMKAMQSSGTTKQFTQNFNALMENTRDAVKLLQTTRDGALSVIKELQNTGFRSPAEIRTQLMQAKAMGDLTGVGAQNMMMIGQAGARAVQGTPWAAATGAGMYQGAATTVGMMAQSSPAMMGAVERAGGIGAAGGVVARSQMNFLMSGMGTKVLASVMNANGSINADMMDRMRSGGVSAYEITSRASNIGYAMGAGGRAKFDLLRMRAANAMSPMDMSMLQQQTFNAWRANKQGDAEAQAWVFSGFTTQNPAEREVMTNYLLSNKQYAQQWGAMQAQRGALGTPTQPRYINPFMRGMRSGMVGVNQMMQASGEAFVDLSSATIGKAISWTSRQANEARFGVWGLAERALGNEAPSRAAFVDAEATYRNIYGTGQSVSAAQTAAIQRVGVSTLKGSTQIGGWKTSPVNASNIYNKLSATDLKNLQLSLASPANDWNKDPNVVKKLGLNAEQIAYINTPGVVGARYRESLGSKFNQDIANVYANQKASYKDIMGRYDAWIKKSDTGTAVVTEARINAAVNNAIQNNTTVNDTSLMGKVVNARVQEYRSRGKDPIANADMFGGKIDIAAKDQALNLAVKAARAAYMDVSKGNWSDYVQNKNGRQTNRDLYNTLVKKSGGTEAEVQMSLSQLLTGAADKWDTTNALNKNILHIAGGDKGGIGKLIALAKQGGDKLSATAAAFDVRLAAEGMNVAGANARTSVSWFNAQVESGRFKSKKFSETEGRALAGLYAGSQSLYDTAMGGVGAGGVLSATAVAANQAALVKKIELMGGAPIADKSVAGISAYLNNPNAGGALGKSRGDEIRRQADRVSTAILSLTGNNPTNSYVDIDGKPQKIDKSTNSEAVVKNLERQQAALNTKMAANREDATAQGTSMSSSVAPQVLNYWNNRWLL